MEIIEMALKLLEKYPLCDNCLGRQFALLGVDLDNKTRGRSLKNVLMMRSHSIAESGDNSSEATRILRILATNGNHQPALRTLSKLESNKGDLGKKCFICSNALEELDELARKSMEALSGQEFRTFLVGSVIPAEVSEHEDEVRGDAGSNWCESLKREINREIGKRLKVLTGKEPDFKSPDLTLSVNPFSKEVAVKSNPLFFSGRYKKLVRGIPQATWLCKKCGGSGCPDCNWTGRIYEYSIQDFISKPFLEETGGVECKFHGAGREDVDARMLGNGRPFIIEIKLPKKRLIDLSRVTEKVSRDSEGRVEVLNLGMSSRVDLRRIKSLSTTTEKTYKAVVSFERDVTEEDINKLTSELSGATIKQRTPSRVLHRRADKIRVKKVYALQARLVAANKLEAIIRCQGGLYVKELISGDSNRTTPSFSGILSTNAQCDELDVIDVADQFI